jgi:hypothetical protein
MIETRDHRKFFTHQKNFIQLIEFANTFDAQVSVVRVEEADILDLAPLAEAISNPEYDGNGNFQVLELKIPSPQHQPRPKNPEQIKKYVVELFLTGRIVDQAEVLELFKTQTSYNAVATTLHKIRKELQDSGHKIQKIGAGRYSLIRTVA